MAVLYELSLIPDVLDISSYSTEEVAGIRLENLKDALLSEALVRDLREGEWRKLFGDDSRTWHRRGKELLKKLIKQNRLNPFPSQLESCPTCDKEWCEEAIQSHSIAELKGVVCSSSLKSSFASNPLVSSVDSLTSSAWWRDRSSSVRLPRQTSDYIANLRLILDCANSIMFIDPHLDPTRHQYREFPLILDAMKIRSPMPKLEIHRVCYFSAGPGRDIIANSEWESRFRHSLSAVVCGKNIPCEVFIWDDFHYRLVISNLVGLVSDNGFDISGNPREDVVWARLGRKERDDFQRDFDKASTRYSLRHHFGIT